MSNAKTRVEQSQLHDFFEDHLHLPHVEYEVIEEGEVSQAYFYESPEGSRVLRVNSQMKDGFLKDEYAAQHFTVQGVPVPTSYEVGELESGLYFSISERVPGQTLGKFNVDATNSMMPEIFKTLDTIHAVPPAGSGFGWWDLSGNGQFGSWQEAIHAVQKAKDDDMLLSVSFFDKDLHGDLEKEINALLKYSPDERVLVHGDFGFKNALSDGKKITGVIDWQSSMYGDPLYDVAWLEFWRKEQAYSEQFKEHYRSQGQVPPNFDERIRSYLLLTAMTSMAFFAKSDQPEKYEFSKNRLATI